MRAFAIPLFVAVLAGLSACDKAKTTGPSSKADAKPSPGYTLVQELTANTTALSDLDGRVVHKWTSKYNLGGGAYIQPNGNLLRTGILPRNPFAGTVPGLSGVIELLDWDSKQLWVYEFGKPDGTLHHDIALLPNGNVLALGVEPKNAQQQLEAGRDPARMRGESMWLDYIVEIKPNGAKGGEVVWEWHLWDHLIQDFDPNRKNFGDVAANPGKIDINFVEENILARNAGTFSRLQSLGYIGGGQTAPAPTGRKPVMPDWTHANAVTYNAELDQVMISVRGPGELWIIDHGTTTAEAASGKGGKRGRGGDLLYRWGNPQSYQRGTPRDQQLFGQHDPHWIAAGLPGAGNVIIFNNGDNRKDGAYSSIEEITLPLKPDGTYEIDDTKPFGPEKSAWRYTAEPKEEFYSQFLSGVQRLPNGNTLICSGMTTEIFEVTPDGKTVWKRQLSDQPQKAAPVPMKERLGGISKATAERGFTAEEVAFLIGPVPLFGQIGQYARPGGGGPGNRPGGPGGRPTKGLFRAVRYSPDFPAFKDKGLDKKPAESTPAPAVAGAK